MLRPRVIRSRILALLIGMLVVSAPSLGSKKDKKSKLIEETTWGFSFQAPKFKPWKDHPLDGEPNFILAGDVPGKCDLNLSVFVEIVPWGSSASFCRQGYPGNPEAVATTPETTLIRHEEKPITFTLYDQEIVKGGFVQNQLYGYWTRDDLCFELHISAMNCKDFEAAALPIVQSVVLSDDTGATLETVALSRGQGGQPGDWELHMEVAGIYLHNEEAVDPVRARRFYRSAMERSGEEMDARQRWLALSGSGIAWLMEDDGTEAIPHLEEALSVVPESADIIERASMYSETLFNLACAHSLAMEPQAGCAALQRLLDEVPEDARAAEIRSIEEDPQLANVRRAECYQALRADGD